MWEGPRRVCGFAAAGSLCYKMWAGLNGFDPRTEFVLGGVRIGMDYMNLVTAISEYSYAGTRNLKHLNVVYKSAFVDILGEPACLQSFHGGETLQDALQSSLLQRRRQ